METVFKKYEVKDNWKIIAGQFFLWIQYSDPCFSLVDCLLTLILQIAQEPLQPGEQFVIVSNMADKIRESVTATEVEERMLVKRPWILKYYSVQICVIALSDQKKTSEMHQKMNLMNTKWGLARYMYTRFSDSFPCKITQTLFFFSTLMLGD